MIEIKFGHKMIGNVFHIKSLGIGRKQGNSNFGQSDFVSLIEEEIDPDTGQIFYASCLFTSGRWYRQIKYLLNKRLNQRRIK